MNEIFFGGSFDGHSFRARLAFSLRLLKHYIYIGTCCTLCSVYSEYGIIIFMIFFLLHAYSREYNVQSVLMLHANYDEG